MKISFNWLKDYVKVNISPEELADKLTKAGLEVEYIEYLGKKYDNFVVGSVLEVNKHPNADKLSVCKVDVKSAILQIVCGAQNVAIGQKVAVGLIGAIILQNQHDPEKKPFQLSNVMIRGIESHGMICSAYELAIGSDKDGILVLDNDAEIGVPLAEFFNLNDIVYDIGITPNRPDCLNHIGVAREVAAALKKKLYVPPIDFKSKSNKSIKIDVLDTLNCPRYTALVLSDVKVKASPKWMQERLQLVGVRPINNIVDITNYVLMETGQPLHAFDYDKIAGQEIIVRQAIDGEHIVTLDSQGRELKAGMLLICDAEKPLAIAGVMGGADSEISENTVNILLESAYFNPQNIRSTSKKLGISTNASTRFERGADPNITSYAIERAAHLIVEIAGGSISSKIADKYKLKIKPLKVDLQVKNVNKILGTELKESEIVRILSSIGINKISSTKGKIKFSIPTYRPDIEREIDLIEEIARLYGYDNIETKTSTNLKFSSKSSELNIEDEFAIWLSGRGFNEVITNSLQRKDTATQVTENFVEILNPISRDMASMRTSMLTSMLEVIRYNVYRQNKNLNLFELGKVYFTVPEKAKERNKLNFIEERRLIMIRTGFSETQKWYQNERFSDIFDIKGDIQDLFEKILLDKYKFIPYSTTKALVDSVISIEIEDFEVGYIGSVSKEILKQYDIEQDVAVAELSIDKLRKFISVTKRYKLLPSFPMITRDLAFVVERKIPVAEIKAKITSYAGELLVSVEIFDIYEGDQIRKDKKSCAFSLHFLSRIKTLTDNEIDIVINKVVNGLQKDFNAILRK